MADPFERDESYGFHPGASRAKDELNQRFQDLRRDASSTKTAGDGRPGAPVGERAGAWSDDTSAGFRRQASQAADEAKSAAASIAEQARTRLNDIVDQQKAAGADKISGVAKAVHSAAGDLDETSPQLGRLVRTAADSVERIAEDVRSRDIGEVFNSLADFGRRQPVAFFGGAVVAGFMLARFFKSDAPLVDASSLHGDRAV